MRKEITGFKPTPILEGEDARRFVENMRRVRPVPPSQYLRAKRLYERLKENEKLRKMCE